MFSINLLLSRSFNSFLHLDSTSFLLFKKSHSFLFCLSYLLIKNFFLSTFHISKSFCLSVNQFLSSVLLLLEFLIFSISTQLIKSLFLFSIFLNTLNFFEFFLFLKLLSLNKLVICFFEVCSLLHLFLSSLHFSLSLTLQLFFYLSTNEFSLKHFILHAFDALHLKGM